jgi:hypothetical protein
MNAEIEGACGKCGELFTAAGQVSEAAARPDVLKHLDAVCPHCQTRQTITLWFDCRPKMSEPDANPPRQA